jgi:hypothetical protein
VGDTVMAAPTFEVDVLGGVGQEGQPVEGADDMQLVADLTFTQHRLQLVDVDRPGAPGADRGASNALDEVEHRRTGLAVDDIAEEASEQSDVGAERVG